MEMKRPFGHISYLREEEAAQPVRFQHASDDPAFYVLYAAVEVLDPAVQLHFALVAHVFPLSRHLKYNKL